MITVRHLSGDKYEVKVSGATVTIHRVTLREADRQRLGGKDVSAEQLIEESFRFLLVTQLEFDLSQSGDTNPLTLLYKATRGGFCL